MCRDRRLGCHARRRDERCLRRAVPARPPRPPPQRSAGGRSPRLPDHRHKRLAENSDPLSARARRPEDRVSTEWAGVRGGTSGRGGGGRRQRVAASSSVNVTGPCPIWSGAGYTLTETPARREGPGTHVVAEGPSAVSVSTMCRFCPLYKLVGGCLRPHSLSLHPSAPRRALRCSLRRSSSTSTVYLHSVLLLPSRRPEYHHLWKKFVFWVVIQWTEVKRRVRARGEWRTVCIFCGDRVCLSFLYQSFSFLTPLPSEKSAPLSLWKEGSIFRS